MHHADERLNYKYILIDVGTLNYVLNSFFYQVMIIDSVDTAVSITVVFGVSQTETPKSWWEANAHRLLVSSTALHT